MQRVLMNGVQQQPQRKICIFRVVQFGQCLCISRDGLTTMPTMPWHRAPRKKGPPKPLPPKCSMGYVARMSVQTYSSMHLQMTGTTSTIFLACLFQYWCM